MPRPYPREFRDDLVRVARNRDDGVMIEQIATDFGVHPMTLTKWMRQADIDEGAKVGKSTGDSAELRELRRRNRLLELTALAEIPTDAHRNSPPVWLRREGRASFEATGV
ncbi:hypothetical protein MKUB_54660 [Mycobacterium kubicae]|uniref:Transposase n=1 Tax=Mycobacterium kubicae TaxID=120959 RepID=A0ABQ1BWF3_9MYCO|nr:transposase [Mycobacterium kubicae]ORV96499.1 hypothetical protein AWC13_18880 [Mycobacterium kubicae]GFG67976.1 hypothetical protein MKUB_54660 [Mycobacterium kubicae]